VKPSDVEHYGWRDDTFVSLGKWWGLANTKHSLNIWRIYPMTENIVVALVSWYR